MDWKEGIKVVAPTLGGLLATFGGPGGMLAGAAVTAVANALGVPATGDPVKDNDAISAVMAGGMTPEQKAALIQADTDIKKAMIDAGLQEKKIAADTEKAYIADVADARSHNANTVGILRLGYMINLLSYICVGGVGYGCFFVLTGAGLHVDPGLAATVGTLVGGTVQWVLSNAAQANGFFFGSSPSSRQAAVDLGKAASNLPQGKGK